MIKLVRSIVLYQRRSTYNLDNKKGEKIGRMVLN